MKLKNIFLKKSTAVLLGLNIFASPSFAWNPWAQFENTDVYFGGDGITTNVDGTITIHNAMFTVNGQFVQTFLNNIDEYTTRYFIYIQNLMFYVDIQDGNVVNYGIAPLFQIQQQTLMQMMPIQPHPQPQQFVQAQNFVTVDDQQQSLNVTQQQQLSPQISRSAEIRALGSQESSKDILQTKSKDSKSIKSQIPEEESAKGKRRKQKWNVTSIANQIIFNGIKDSIANDYMVIISKDNKDVTINVAENGNPNTSYFKIVGTLTGKDDKKGIQKASWKLINNNEAISKITKQIKYIHFDGNKYSASTDKNDYRFIFCQRCATRCIQKLLGENVEITYIKNGNIVSCPIKFNEDYGEKFADKAKTHKALFCQDCNSLNNLNHQ